MVELTGKTHVNLLIGSPIAQVLAPGRLTRRMAQIGYDGLLVPMQILPGRLETSLPALMAMPNVDSILVTLPHKFAAARHCSALSPRAQLLGAVNAMRRDGHGGWFGDNFDGAGMVESIRTEGCTIAGKAVFIAGAGGAGSSIAVSVLEAGAARLTLHDSDTAKLEALRAMLETQHPGKVTLSSTVPEDCQIVINATPMGLRASDPLPVAVDQLKPGMLVADVITDPIETPLLLEARKRGFLTRTGSQMLDGQLELLLLFMVGAGG